MRVPFDQAAAAKHKREDDVWQQAAQAKKAKKVDDIIESIYNKLKHKEWTNDALAKDEDGELLAPIVWSMIFPIKRKLRARLPRLQSARSPRILPKSLIYSTRKIFTTDDAFWYSSFEDTVKDQMRDDKMWELSPEDIYFHWCAD